VGVDVVVTVVVVVVVVVVVAAAVVDVVTVVMSTAKLAILVQMSCRLSQFEPEQIIPVR